MSRVFLPWLPRRQPGTLCSPALLADPWQESIKILCTRITRTKTVCVTVKRPQEHPKYNCPLHQFNYSLSRRICDPIILSQCTVASVKSLKAFRTGQTDWQKYVQVSIVCALKFAEIYGLHSPNTDDHAQGSIHSCAEVETNKQTTLFLLDLYNPQKN